MLLCRWVVLDAESEPIHMVSVQRRPAAAVEHVVPMPVLTKKEKLIIKIVVVSY
jgi:hypothetical protein